MSATNRAWEWLSQNRAAFETRDWHGSCESCGERIYEGEPFEQSFCDDGAGGETSVLVCEDCIERDRIQCEALAVAEGWH